MVFRQVRMRTIVSRVTRVKSENEIMIESKEQYKAGEFPLLTRVLIYS